MGCVRGTGGAKGETAGAFDRADLRVDTAEQFASLPRWVFQGRILRETRNVTRRIGRKTQMKSWRSAALGHVGRTPPSGNKAPCDRPQRTPTSGGGRRPARLVGQTQRRSCGSCFAVVGGPRWEDRFKVTRRWEKPRRPRPLSGAVNTFC